MNTTISKPTGKPELASNRLSAEEARKTVAKFVASGQIKFAPPLPDSMVRSFRMSRNLRK